MSLSKRQIASLLIVLTSLITACETNTPNTAPNTWKITTMQAAQEKLAACEFVKSGKLRAEPVKEASTEDPNWYLNLAYVDADRLLDRCMVSATTGDVVCRGDSCP